MTEHHDETFDLDLSRRRLLAAAGIAGAAALAPSLVHAADGQVASLESKSSDALTTPPVTGLHLQFGADASSEMVVSWHSLQPVQQPRVLLGRPDGRLEKTVAARETSYVDAKSGQTVHAWHARIEGLKADTAYL